MTRRPHVLPVRSRREFLQRAGCGFGALAFAQLLGLDGLLASGAPALSAPLNPLAPKPPHFAFVNTQNSESREGVDLCFHSRPSASPGYPPRAQAFARGSIMADCVGGRV